VGRHRLGWYGADRDRRRGQGSERRDLREEAKPWTFTPALQHDAPSQMTFYIRSEQDPRALAQAAQRTVNRLDASLPVYDIKTVEMQIRRRTSSIAFFAMLSAAFAVLATILASIGLYGVTAYNAARRTQEMGIRVALGAEGAHILRLVMREVLCWRWSSSALAHPLRSAGYDWGRRVDNSSVHSRRICPAGAAREPYRPDASVALRVGHSLCRSQKNHKHCRVVVAKAVLNSPTIHRTSSKSCPKNQPACLIDHREKDAAGWQAMYLSSTASTSSFMWEFIRPPQGVPFCPAVWACRVGSHDDKPTYLFGCPTRKWIGVPAFFHNWRHCNQASSVSMGYRWTTVGRGSPLEAQITGSRLVRQLLRNSNETTRNSIETTKGMKTHVNLDVSLCGWGGNGSPAAGINK